MKIVTNCKGLYAIRKGFWPFYKYFDMKVLGYWWKKSNGSYVNCWTTDRSKVECWFGILNPRKAVIILTENDKQMKIEEKR